MKGVQEVPGLKPLRASALGSLLCLGFLALATPAAADSETAAQWIEGVSKQAGAILAGPAADESQRASRIETLLDDNIDLSSLGNFALGRHARQADSEQLQRFDRTFHAFALRNFSRLVTGVDREALRITSSKPIEEHDTLVTSLLDQTGQEPLEVVWRVRSQGGGHKVVDVMVEGISMALTLREEFSSVTRLRGIDGLIDELRRGSSGKDDDARFAGATRHLLQSAMQPGTFTFRGLSN